MNTKLIDRIVNAVLYEGYILYPYRPSVKNRQRFTFGRIYPHDYHLAESGREPSSMKTGCLVQHSGGFADSRLVVEVRFLHPMERDVGQLHAVHSAWDDIVKNEEWTLVNELRLGDHIYESWQEATEQTIKIPPINLGELIDNPPSRIPFRFDAERTVEPLHEDGEQVGVLIRTSRTIKGIVTVEAEAVDQRVCSVSVRIENQTPVGREALDNRDEVIMRTMASAHTILHVKGAEFFSMTDPPEAYTAAAAQCENTCTWPVLVGEDDAKDTLLSSPIILSDYPELAPESPGDFFDGAEIDEMLTLRIMTMTDEEKHRMRHIDDRARQLLQRTESMGDDELMNLHGKIRDLRPVSDDPLLPWTTPQGKPPVKEMNVDGKTFRVGGRVKIAPRARADVMDLALKGRVGIIESIEEDFEGQIHLALVIEDDPGRDLGMMRQPGHRFFYGTDEVELIDGST